MCTCLSTPVYSKSEVLTQRYLRCVCDYCLLQAQSRRCVARLRSWHQIFVMWRKMMVSRQDIMIKMRTPVLALLSLSIIIMLTCDSYLGGLGSKEVPIEVKELPLHNPQAVWGIVPDAFQRCIALYQIPPRSKGPGTSTVPFLAAAPLPAQSSKLRGMRLRDHRILHVVSPPSILPGFACVCVHLWLYARMMHASTCYQHATQFLAFVFVFSWVCARIMHANICYQRTTHFLSIRAHMTVL